MEATRVRERGHGRVVDLVTTTQGEPKAPVHVSVLTVGPEGGPSTSHAEILRRPGLTARRVREASEALAHQDALAALPDFLAEHPAVATKIYGGRVA